MSAFKPIRDAAVLEEPLDDRVMAGFGGVAEYGITVRWNKNFLKIVRLLLERRREFALFGGIRFGGTISADDAFAMGFDHIALAIGAGRPTILDMPNALARGVRTASDFLMALQLTGARQARLDCEHAAAASGRGDRRRTDRHRRRDRIARLLSDAGREVFSSAAKVLPRGDADAALAAFVGAEERGIAEEFIRHARTIRAENAAAAQARRPARVLELLQSWGGVTIAYRRGLRDSPSYTLNHEEVHKALEEGIRFAEGLTPLRVELGPHGSAEALRVAVRTIDHDGRWIDAGQRVLPARTILVAAGTQPNTVLAREDPHNFRLDGRYFAAVNDSGGHAPVEKSISKPIEVNVLLDRREDGRCLSFFGDLHPSFHGNVVKAIASAKQGYPVVSRVLSEIAVSNPVSTADFHARLNSDLRATVHKVERLTPNIIEVVVHAPLAARRFEPGSVLSPAEFRDPRALAAFHSARDGRPGAHRRVGR